MTTERILDLNLNTIMVYSDKDVLAIHRYIFQDTYEWAGNYRQVNISKSGNAFLPIQSFELGEMFLNILITEFHEKANSGDELITSFSKILDNLNYFHHSEKVIAVLRGRLFEF